MQTGKQALLSWALTSNVIQFGQFQLKSGRTSPYFFNSGKFNHGHALNLIGQSLADLISKQSLLIDTLFGPSYKGIPLVSATAMALAADHNMNLPYCYNRKEAKQYGDKGIIIGAPLQGQVVLIDDVVTAGTTIRESLDLISQHNARLAAVTVLFDRQERGQGQDSTLEELAREYGVPIFPLLTTTDVIEHLKTQPNLQTELASMLKYRKQYGITLSFNTP